MRWEIREAHEELVIIPKWTRTPTIPTTSPTPTVARGPHPNKLHIPTQNQLDQLILRFFLRQIELWSMGKVNLHTQEAAASLPHGF